MSGRDHDPITAFFPSIDRNLMLDLDRRLRGAKPAQPSVSEIPAPTPGRPTIARVVEAVEQAAMSIAAMSTRIEELEGHIDDLEAAHRQMEAQLSEAVQGLRDSEMKLRAESDRALRSEAVSAQHASRAGDLERDLASAHNDLARVTDTIAAALGLPIDRSA